MSFFPVIGKNWYIYHIDGRDHMAMNCPLLHYSDVTGENIINKGASEYGIVDTWFDKNEFDAYNKDIYFHRAMSDTIYWIGPVNGQICPTYIIDFGKDRMPLAAKKEIDMLKMANIIRESGCSFSLGNLVVGRNFLHFKWTSERTLTDYHHFVDRFNYQSFKVSKNDLKVFDIPVLGILSADSNEFTAYAYLGEIEKEKLLEFRGEQKVDSLFKLDIDKVLQLDDPNTPILVRFNTISTEPE